MKDCESRERETFYLEGKTTGMTAVSHQKPQKQKEVAQHFSSAGKKKKKAISPEFYIQQKYPSGKKGHKTFSDEGKPRDLFPADLS